MNLLTMLVLVATLATIASFISGIVSMTHDSEVAHRNSAEWMGWRVAFQAAAVVMILLALSGWH
ncbi:MAG: twin transmembrane helix small protein [Burkholderiales bacterium]